MIFLKNLKNIFKNYQMAILFVFWLVFFIATIFSFVFVKSSLQFIFSKGPEIPNVKVDSSVRINFENYNFVVSRIEKAGSFVPSSVEVPNPFIAK